MITEIPLPTIGRSIGDDAPRVSRGAPRETRGGAKLGRNQTALLGSFDPAATGDPAPREILDVARRQENGEALGRLRDRREELLNAGLRQIDEIGVADQQILATTDLLIDIVRGRIDAGQDLERATADYVGPVFPLAVVDLEAEGAVGPEDQDLLGPLRAKVEKLLLAQGLQRTILQDGDGQMLVDGAGAGGFEDLAAGDDRIGYLDLTEVEFRVADQNLEARKVGVGRLVHEKARYSNGKAAPAASSTHSASLARRIR